MSAPTATATAWQWPPDVLDFAVKQQVEPYLDPLLAALHNAYPTATNFLIRLEDDPEIRDDRHIVFEVSVPATDVPNYVAATRPWHRELSRICPAPLTHIFRHLLLPVGT
jgi:hypothetical protein